METTAKLLDVFQQYRMAPTSKDQYEQVGRKILQDKMGIFVNKGNPLEFVMLGFPFKSTNIRDKVIGTLPDMAEEATLANFSAFDKQIKEVYKPGAKISIVSDGLIFNDILSVKDSIVGAYKEVSVDMAKGGPVKFFDLTDFYNKMISIDGMRTRLMSQFGVTEEWLQKEILTNDDVNYLYRGMLHFMEEELAMHEFPSRNQLRKKAKEITRVMMLRNEAYSNLVRSEFSSFIRLSMHPSINNGKKYSFQLIPSPNAHHSAWHSALVVNGDEVSTMHRKDAEQAGYQLVNKDGRPYYFNAN